jgi:hypothetical protein
LDHSGGVVFEVGNHFGTLSGEIRTAEVEPEKSM